MKTPSSGGSSSRRPGHRRIADFLAEDQDSGDELFSPATSGGMLPIFLNDQSELVEVMLELDEESMVVRSVTPTYGGAAAVADPDPGGSLSRSSSTASRIRRKFAWLRSPSPRRSPSPVPAKESAAAALAARDARRRQARLDRTSSGAQRALKGLRFISRTTGSVGAAELWQRVEERFASLAEDGLLSRDDFGECIGLFFLPSHSLGSLFFV